jgi:hypothetical protein
MPPRKQIAARARLAWPMTSAAGQTGIRNDNVCNFVSERQRARASAQKLDGGRLGLRVSASLAISARPQVLGGDGTEQFGVRCEIAADRHDGRSPQEQRLHGNPPISANGSRTASPTSFGSSERGSGPASGAGVFLGSIGVVSFFLAVSHRNVAFTELDTPLPP